MSGTMDLGTAKDDSGDIHRLMLHWSAGEYFVYAVDPESEEPTGEENLLTFEHDFYGKSTPGLMANWFFKIGDLLSESELGE